MKVMTQQTVFQEKSFNVPLCMKVIKFISCVCYLSIMLW